MDGEKQLSRSNVASVEGLLNLISPIAPTAAGLFKPQITQITQIFLFSFLLSVKSAKSVVPFFLAAALGRDG
jgi:hypothetical protein